MLSDDDPLVRRVQGEYREIPGLLLTPQQAARLWALELPVCQSILDRLVAAGWLRRTEGGAYVSTGLR